MYSRPPMGRFPRGMRVPENYSGNAFTPPNEPTPPENETLSENIDQPSSPDTVENENAEKSESIPVGGDTRPTFKLDLGRFFSGNKSFGMEEFLIIALILLIAQNDTNDDTLIFLILLLFIR